MRIVLDTNVLVSGLLRPFGPPGQIVRLISSGQVTLCHDSRILSEYREVLLRPRFDFDPGDVSALLEQIKMSGIPVSSVPLRITLPDLDDAVFLEVALSGKADYLITGNLRHFAPYKEKSLRILSPADFIRSLTTREP